MESKPLERYRQISEQLKALSNVKRIRTNYLDKFEGIFYSKIDEEYEFLEHEEVKNSTQNF